MAQVDENLHLDPFILQIDMILLAGLGKEPGH